MNIYDWFWIFKNCQTKTRYIMYIVFLIWFNTIQISWFCQILWLFLILFSLHRCPNSWQEEPTCNRGDWSCLQKGQSSPHPNPPPFWVSQLPPDSPGPHRGGKGLTPKHRERVMGTYAGTHMAKTLDFTCTTCVFAYAVCLSALYWWCQSRGFMSQRAYFAEIK